MMSIKRLTVRWSKTETATYYVDADKFSRAHEQPEGVTLDSTGGKYHFNPRTGSVTIDTGAEVRTVKVDNWELTIEE